MSKISYYYVNGILNKLKFAKETAQMLSKQASVNMKLFWDSEGILGPILSDKWLPNIARDKALIEKLKNAIINDITSGTRVCITAHSYGGYLTNLALKEVAKVHPDLLKQFVTIYTFGSVAPISKDLGKTVMNYLDSQDRIAEFGSWSKSRWEPIVDWGDLKSSLKLRQKYPYQIIPDKYFWPTQQHAFRKKYMQKDIELLKAFAKNVRPVEPVTFFQRAQNHACSFLKHLQEFGSRIIERCKRLLKMLNPLRSVKKRQITPTWAPVPSNNMRDLVLAS